MKLIVKMFMNSVFEIPIDLKYYDITNKKVLGKMKDEFNGVKMDDGVLDDGINTLAYFHKDIKNL